MFEMRLKQGTLFKTVLEALSDLFVKARFDFSGKGLELHAMDTRRIAHVALILRADAFRHCRCDSDFSVGLTLADMTQAFRCANNDDIITIDRVHDFCDFVSFTFASPDDTDILYFDPYLVGVNGVPLQIPETPESEYQAIVRMPSAKFMRICNQLSSFGDGGDKNTVVFIRVKKECVDFLTRGKSGTLKIVCKQPRDKPTEPTLIIEMKEEVALTFDLRCMNSSSKMSTLSDQVTISLSSKLPAVFEYKILEMSYIRYCMSPTKEDEMQKTAKEDKMQN